ncbi:MAG: efflux RND transporter periplasmic adaptor subunit [Spirochaetales bacterium]|nr:efflux RND transporter periplasmic adaptor subunit [Spirochaetales bacterium]MCF7939108.1 efflux RND transporter periplasmic adaptor subunit [Spirochaetales bacterium]
MKSAALLGSVFAILVLFFSCSAGGSDGESGATWEENAERNADKQPLAVEAVEISRGKLIESIKTSGVISGINEAYVVSETQGIITEVDFKLGDAVEKGQILLQVDDTIPSLNAEQAKQAYETAKINLEATERLYNEGNSSRAQLAQAQSNYNGAKANYERAAKALEDCYLKAPISGLVAQKDSSIAVGNYLSLNTRAARIVDIRSLKLEVPVGAGEVGLIEEGAEAVVDIPNCPKENPTATVEAIAAGSDPATGSYTVVLTWKNNCPDTVRSGMSATAEIETREEEPVIIIPTSAVMQRQEEKYVFIDDEGTVTPVVIRIGRSIGNKTEVKSGLSEGQVLIISALTNLSPGDPVDSTLIGKSGNWK